MDQLMLIDDSIVASRPFAQVQVD